MWLFLSSIRVQIFIEQLWGTDHEEDPLKWIEENIPESVETENPLPVIDSDEEIETVIYLWKYELLRE